MILNVKVIPNAKVSRIQELGKDCLKVHLGALPVEGKANKALIELFLKHYKVKRSHVTIIRGERSRNGAHPG